VRAAPTLSTHLGNGANWELPRHPITSAQLAEDGKPRGSPGLCIFERVREFRATPLISRHFSVATTFQLTVAYRTCTWQHVVLCRSHAKTCHLTERVRVFRQLAPPSVCSYRSSAPIPGRRMCAASPLRYLMRRTMVISRDRASTSRPCRIFRVRDRRCFALCGIACTPRAESIVLHLSRCATAATRLAIERRALAGVSNRNCASCVET